MNTDNKLDLQHSKIYKERVRLFINCSC